MSNPTGQIEDTNWDEAVLTRVEKHSDGCWTICHGAVCFGDVPADTPVEPQPGMVARFYGGSRPGSRVYGLLLDGALVFYRTAEQREAEEAARKASYAEHRRKTALEPIVPETQIEGFEWTADMRQISGIGGGYERTCRAMVSAGCKWWSDRPSADPQFHGFRGVFGVIIEDNEDAKALTKAVIDASGGDCTGAMHQAAISHILAWHGMGSWITYQRTMREMAREGAYE